jgi:gamma-glutamylcyclotransferase (GGCT)/AIG2-like uncharacterized protein YtfP
VIGSATPVVAIGCLYDTGRGYPGATFGADAAAAGAGLVHGSVVELDPARSGEALAALDRYEGDEYERVVIRTESGAEVATYAWIAPLTGCEAIAEGRWID